MGISLEVSSQYTGNIYLSYVACRNVLDKCSTKFGWFWQVRKCVVLNYYKNFLLLLHLFGLNYVGVYLQQLAAAGISETGHLPSLM